MADILLKIPACVNCVFPILLIFPPSLRGFYMLNQSPFLKETRPSCLPSVFLIFFSRKIFILICPPSFEYSLRILHSLLMITYPPTYASILLLLALSAHSFCFFPMAFYLFGSLCHVSNFHLTWTLVI